MNKNEFIKKHGWSDSDNAFMKSDLEEVIKDESMNFGVWYSGMEGEKVERAYERYLIEVKNRKS